MQDKSFMEELYKLMEDELSNSELDIIHITEMLHISRTKFYYKIKGLTGQTPATFFRTYKLNRAAQMLTMGQLCRDAAFLMQIYIKIPNYKPVEIKNKCHSPKFCVFL